MNTAINFIADKEFHNKSFNIVAEKTIYQLRYR